jgi:hypothetical protein
MDYLLMLLPSVSGKRTIAGFAFLQGTYGKLKVGVTRCFR